MSIADQHTTSHKFSSPNKRPAPFSIRLNDDERARLIRAADGIPLGSYIKATMLGHAPPVRRRISTVPIKDRQAMGKALALLGQSRIASNLNQLAHAANLGILPVDSETVAELKEAVETLRLLRDLLMTALGYRLEDC